MDSGMGAGTLEARIILGAVIIKHHENLSDEGTIEAIQENLYMQYFLGLPTFKKSWFKSLMQLDSGCYCCC